MASLFLGWLYLFSEGCYHTFSYYCACCMYLRYLFITFLLACVNGLAHAQPLAAYVDLQNQFTVWDKGIVRKIDFLPPTDYKIGRIAIPFIDNSRSFKIYYNNGVHPINIGFTNEYRTSDYLVSFLNAKSLNVYDRGNVKNLTGLCSVYYLGDSVLLFFDDVHSEYKAYYAGNVFPIQSFLANDTISQVKVKNNIIAFNNYANQFLVFYQGRITKLEEFPITTFDAGKNTVAYVDANRQFKVFHDGRTFVADAFAPNDFVVGDDVVAFTSNDGNFKIFYQDSVRTIGYMKAHYVVGDNVVAYQDATGYLKAFYKGDITNIESYFPNDLQVQYNSLAYINNAGLLRLFTEGELYDVTNSVNNDPSDPEPKWTLNYDVLRYKVAPNVYRVFYKGQDY